MTEVFSDAIVSGHKVTIGKILSICPVKKGPRQVSMGFNGIKRKIFLGSRIVFRCSVFKEFLNSHQLDWRL
jgi:hypothetical protein